VFLYISRWDFMSGFVRPREANFDPQYATKAQARAAFRKHFGDRYFKAFSGRSLDVRDYIPSQSQTEIAAEVMRLRNTATASSRFVERHCGIMDSFIVMGFAFIASCGGGGALGHWLQDGAKKFNLFHPSLGAIGGAIGGVMAAFSVMGWAHKKLMDAARSLKRYEKSSVACDALLSGYITEPSVQEALLDAAKEARRPGDRGLPEGIRYKLIDMRACHVLHHEVEKKL
jgi:hypothetical protein